MNRVLVLLVLSFLIPALVLVSAQTYPNPGHPADTIGPGTIADMLTITSSGVGIGDTTPSSTLDVAGNIMANYICDRGGTCHDITDLATGGSPWSVSGGNVYRTSGNVGIGTSTISERLTVSGNILATGNIVASGTVCDSNGCIGSGGGGTSVWSQSGTVAYYNTGDVGIGDSSPDGSLRLDVEGYIGATKYCDASGGNCYPITDLVGGGGTCTCDPADCNCDPEDCTCPPGAGYWSSASGGIHYSDGKVGIGTNGPASALHVTGTDNDATPNVVGTQIAAGLIELTRTGSFSPPYIDFKNDIGGGDYDARIILSSDNVLGIGGASLSVGGNVHASQYCDASGGNCYPITDLIAGGSTSPWTASGSDVYVGTSIQVGIGVTSPGEPLEVRTDSGGEAIAIEEYYSTDGEQWEIGVDSLGNLDFQDDGTQRLSFIDGTGDIEMYNDADILNIDRIVGYNDLRLYGDSSGGPDIFIATDGDVGIGDSSPDGGLKLDVGGGVGATWYCDENGKMCVNGGTLKRRAKCPFFTSDINLHRYGHVSWSERVDFRSTQAFDGFVNTHGLNVEEATSGENEWLVWNMCTENSDGTVTFDSPAIVDGNKNCFEPGRYNNGLFHALPRTDSTCRPSAGYPDYLYAISPGSEGYFCTEFGYRRALTYEQGTRNAYYTTSYSESTGYWQRSGGSLTSRNVVTSVTCEADCMDPDTCWQPGDYNV
jgi:hypothetical protein